jgi:hypothetical protein
LEPPRQLGAAPAHAAEEGRKRVIDEYGREHCDYLVLELTASDAAAKVGRG